MNLYGAIAGMTTGALTVLIWEYGAFFGLYSIVPGFLFSLVAIFVVSVLTAKKDDPSVLLFDKLEKQFWVEVKDK